MFKIFNLTKPSNVQQMFLTGRNQRTNNFIIPSHKTSKRANTISISGPKIWNKIPIEIKNSKNKITFHKLVKNYIPNII